MKEKLLEKKIILLIFACLAIWMFAIIGVGISKASMESTEDNIELYLSQEIEKLQAIKGKKVLLQYRVDVGLNEYVQKSNEEIATKVVEINGKNPTSVKVLFNGSELENKFYDYKQDAGKVVIKLNSSINIQNIQNTYKLIYEYEDTNLDEINEQEIECQVVAKVKTEEQGKSLIAKEVGNLNLEQKGEIISVEGEITEEIYKGYLYEGIQYETPYTENYIIEISNADEKDKIYLDRENEAFIKGEEELSTNYSLIYKSSVINKQEVMNTLGEEGELKVIYNGITVTINKDTETDENGNVVINYEEVVNSIKVKTSETENIGILTIRNEKAIKPNTEYTQEQLKEIEYLKEEIKVNNSIATLTSALLDTKAEANIEINTTDLLTLERNENVHMVVTLTSDTNAYDLYKNPVIEVMLPHDMEMEINNVQQLNYENEVNLAGYEMITTEDGRRAIKIYLQGEQRTYGSDVNPGIQVAIIGNIDIANTVPSKTDKIEVKITNENKQEEITAEAEVNINSRYGLLVINNIEDFNNEEENVEVVNEYLTNVKLEKGEDEKVGTETFSIINNYEEEIYNVAIIGTIGSEEQVNQKTLKSTIETTLSNLNTGNDKEVTVYYSTEETTEQESESWVESSEEIEQIKAFKIELEDSLQPAETYNLSYSLAIPSSLSGGESVYTKTIVAYQQGEIESENTTILNLETEGDPIDEVPEESIIGAEEEEGLSVLVYAMSGGEYLHEGDTVMAGQGIRYYISLKNDTGHDLTNVKLEATNTNAIYYGMVEYTYKYEGNMYSKGIRYGRDEELTSKIFEIEEIKAGEQVELNYQIAVKDVEDNNQTLTGTISITGDNLEEITVNNIENNISRGDLSVSLLCVMPEQVYCMIATEDGEMEEILQDINFGEKEDLPIEITIKNITQNAVSDVIVNVPIPNTYTVNDDERILTDGLEIVEKEDSMITFKISSIEAGEEYQIVLLLTAKEFSGSETECYSRAYFMAEYGDEEYISNDIERTIVKTQTKIKGVQTTNIETGEVKEGDNIKFFIELENESNIESNISILDAIDGGLTLNSIRIWQGDEEIEESVASSLFVKNIIIPANGKVKIEIDTTLEDIKLVGSTIKNIVEISGIGVQAEINDIELRVRRPQSNTKTSTYQISGNVWLDKNEDGCMDSNESKISNIQVILFNEETNSIAQNVDGNNMTAKTGNDGKYSFSGIASGRYTVIFQYDTDKYEVSAYKKEGVNEASNSDVTIGTVNIDNQQMQVAKTNTLELSNNDLEGVNAGFVERKVFDMKLQKYVNKVTVQDNTGTKTYNFNKSQLAKVEIHAKSVEGAIVTIEYVIEVTNEGEIPGYVDEIIDYLPSDLKLVSNDKTWKSDSDGNLRTQALAKQKIEAGETKSVTLTVQKQMTKSNTGTTINIAEIGKSSNSFSINDRDSTGSNKKQGEDDMSNAEMIISVKTGKIIIYTALIVTVMAIMATGIYYIKKKVIN